MEESERKRVHRISVSTFPNHNLITELTLAKVIFMVHKFVESFQTHYYLSPGGLEFRGIKLSRFSRYDFTWNLL